MNSWWFDSLSLLPSTFVIRHVCLVDLFVEVAQAI